MPRLSSSFIWNFVLLLLLWELFSLRSSLEGIGGNWSTLFEDIRSRSVGNPVRYSSQHLRSVSLGSYWNPVYCYNISFCCGRWDVSADEWWLHHPDWEIVLEDETGFCWAPMQEQKRRNFLQVLHQQQWGINITHNNHYNSSSSSQSVSLVYPNSYGLTDPNSPDGGVNCSNLCTTVPISSGYSASISFLQKTLWYSVVNKKPFQVIKRGPWMYATDNVNHSWAYCEDQDASCFYLPLSPCSRIREEKEKKIGMPNAKDPEEVRQWLWSQDYITRPKHGLRHASYEMKKPYIASLREGCIALHIRRSDVGTRTDRRRYAAIQEYLDLLPPSNQTATIFLLADDASTIDELHKYYLLNNNTQSNYKWVYTNKTRNRGNGRGFDGHIPRGSAGPEELAWIVAELELAGKYCNTLVHGASGFATFTWSEMRIYHGDGNVKKYFLDTSIPMREWKILRTKPAPEREVYMMDRVDAFYVSRGAT